ncbi:MAG: hypothetical protein KDD15_07050, partial [Lewinella sp.]|nr:hypothetical protein [Lewinella sp.]
DACPISPPSFYCCPGENLVRNGNFEDGNTGFFSAFTYNAQVDQSATLPGMYNVVSGTEAAIISPTWASVADPSYCSATQGRFMVVNGENGGVPEGEGNIPVKRVIWEQSFTVDDWASYKFCFEAKNLNQLGFNVVPAIEVVFSDNSIDNIEQTIYAGSSPCDWYGIERNIDLWGTGTNLTIQIVLDQERLGDGNDLAIDNIALIKIEKCPPTSVYFDLATQSDGDTYQVIANSATTAECEAIFWEICVVDPQSPTQDCLPGTKLTNPSAWWFEDTNFPGYLSSGTLGDTALPGKFEYGKLYKITRGTWGECRGWNQFTRYVGAPRLTRRIPIYTEDEYMFNRERILKDFSKTIGIKRN